MSDASLRDIFARALTEYSDQSGVSDDNDEVTLDELGLGLLPDLVRHAAGVVLAGFPTLAIRVGTKRPLHPGGSELPNHQEFWLRSVVEVESAYISEPWGCQFAVMTGVPNADGDCLVALDNDGGDLGALLAQAGEQAQRWARETLLVQRENALDRGHLYGLLAADGCPPTTELAEGVEWRGTGGYVLLPGAKHPTGTRYEITRSGTVPLRVPRELIELVRSKAQPKPTKPTKPALKPTTPTTPHVEARPAQQPDEIGYEDLDGPAKARVDAYVAGALDGIAANLVASRVWPPGMTDERGRGWEKLQADAAYRLARLVLAAWNQLDEDEAYDVFISSAPIDASWTATKREAKWRSQWGLAVRKGPAPYPDDDSEPPLSWDFIGGHAEVREREQEGAEDHTTPPVTGPSIEIAPGVWVNAEAERLFWQEREVHRIIREWAHARMCSPHALLLGVLQRVLVTVPAHVVLPPLIGGKASLNLFGALVAPTGGGKDRAQDVSRDVIQVINGASYVEPPIGTGEGLVSTFGHMEGRGRTRRTVMHAHNALIRVSEVDTWASLIERKGSNLESVVRLANMGQQLGFGYRGDPTTLPAHSYRLCLNVGVQPARGESLLSRDAIDSGTAGRFLWVPALSKDRPPKGERMVDPPSLLIELPRALRSSVEVLVASVVEQAVLDDSYDRLGGETGIDPIDAYRLLMREKVAFVLALLEQRIGIDEDDWRLAGHVLDVSRATRAKARADLAGMAQRRAIGMAVIQRRAADVAVRESRVWKNCYARVPKVLSKTGEPMSVSAISDQISSYQREHLEDVLVMLAKAGVIDLSSDDLYGLTEWRK